MEGVEGAVAALADPKIVCVPFGTPDDPPGTEFSDHTHPTVEGHAHYARSCSSRS